MSEEEQAQSITILPQIELPYGKADSRLAGRGIKLIPAQIQAHSLGEKR